jgi:hypothetical protein
LVLFGSQTTGLELLKSVPKKTIITPFSRLGLNEL